MVNISERGKCQLILKTHKDFGELHWALAAIESRATSKNWCDWSKAALPCFALHQKVKAQKKIQAEACIKPHTGGGSVVNTGVCAAPHQA